ncbi:hypothetical protein [Cellulomonas sp. Y8]|uniref:hypothetical protein n=1 Tax=Cellulomonas sp. Y8 TaxID=2591145 RepID=UPI0011C6E9BB|nr:hypothetical protein [Cellulomonas sp. Y8]
MLPEHLRRHVTDGLADLWTLVADHVWAQWRYENDMPGYRAPSLPRVVDPGEVPDLAGPGAGTGGVRPLVMCGGGKDSLAVLQLLDEAGVEYTTLGYSSSGYGLAEHQHDLIEAVAGSGLRSSGHIRVTHLDDWEDSPYLELAAPAGIGARTASETPFSVFMALPVMLAGGFTHLLVGHELSAGVPNLVWDGEPVNHQWGKSAAAEAALDGYLSDLTGGRCHYASMLGSLSDPLIFGIVARAGGRFASTHSCNVAKPWCLRCPKCLYVWMSARAYLDPAVVEATFGAINLYDEPDLDTSFEALLGLADHTPFECVGSAAEARLAALVCHRSDRGGALIDRLGDWLGTAVTEAEIARLLAADPDADRCPEAWRSAVDPVLREVERAVRDLIDHTASPTPTTGTAVLDGVSFIAPFEQGFTLDLPAFLRRGARQWFWDWHHGDTVEGGGPIPWSVAGDRARANGLVYDVDTYEGTSVVPRTLAELHVDRSATAAPALQWARRRLEAALGDSLAFRSAHVELTPFGIGSIRVRAVPVHPIARPGLARDVCESASSRLADAIREVCTALADDASRHVEDGWSRSMPAAVAGRVKWVHRVLDIRTPEATAADGWCGEILGGGDTPVVRTAGGCVAPGIGTSVVQESSGGAGGDVASVIALANTAWAAADAWSQELLAQSSCVTASRRSGEIAELRAMSDAVAETIDATSGFRAVLHDEVASLTPRQLDFWGHIVRTWHLDDLMDELDRRRGELKSSHRETLDLLQSQLSSRLNTIVTTLTVLSAFSVLAAMIDYFFGGPLSSLDAQRSILFALLGAAAGGGLWVLWRRLGPRRPRTGRDR